MAKKIIAIIGVIASVGGAVANIVHDWTESQKMEALIDEKIADALADKENDDEEDKEETNED